VARLPVRDRAVRVAQVRKLGHPEGTTLGRLPIELHAQSWSRGRQQVTIFPLGLYGDDVGQERSRPVGLRCSLWSGWATRCPLGLCGTWWCPPYCSTRRLRPESRARRPPRDAIRSLGDPSFTQRHRAGENTIPGILYACQPHPPTLVGEFLTTSNVSAIGVGERRDKIASELACRVC
jgi:hypothetical protein